MEDIKYVGLKELEKEEADKLKELVNLYAPKYERLFRGIFLTVAIKKSHVLGRMARYNLKFTADSRQGEKLFVEQSGWGLVKTVRRTCEHMESMLDHKIKRELKRNPKRR